MTDNHIRVDPTINYGYPTIGGAPVDAITMRIWAGEPINEVTDDFHLTRTQAIIACWYQALHGTSSWRDRWGKWRTTTDEHLWSGNHQHLTDPPNQHQ